MMEVRGPGPGLDPRERVAVAFDVADRAEARVLREQLGGALGLAKIGSALFVREGMELVREFKDAGVRVFLDLKFHDIPSVVGKAVEKAVAAKVDYLTVHAAGGAAMIAAAVDAAGRDGAGTKVLGVTVLTSLDLEGWRAGPSPQEESVESAVRRLGALAVGAGAHGLVGSARETAILREIGGPRTFVVTPGIRTEETTAADQARTMGVAEAARSGSDILVVGRGVRQAADPAATLREIQDRLRDAEREAARS
jgi:orotidine-5'-phosphate decarboxylase